MPDSSIYLTNLFNIFDDYSIKEYVDVLVVLNLFAICFLLSNTYTHFVRAYTVQLYTEINV